MLLLCILAESSNVCRHHNEKKIRIPLLAHELLRWVTNREQIFFALLIIQIRLPGRDMSTPTFFINELDWQHSCVLKICVFRSLNITYPKVMTEAMVERARYHWCKSTSYKMIADSLQL